MRAWLLAFLKSPSALPQDPGAGEGRFTVWLPRGAVKKIAARWGVEPSEFLRRLIAAHLPITPAMSANWPVPAHPRPVVKPAPVPRVLDAEFVESSPARLVATDERPAPAGFAWRNSVTVVPAEELELERRMRECCRLEQRLEEMARCLPVGAVYVQSPFYWRIDAPSPAPASANGGSSLWRVVLWLLLIGAGVWLLWRLFSRGGASAAAATTAAAGAFSFKPWFPVG